jgi:acrylyl-CoA reductase (NADPH)
MTSFRAFVATRDGDGVETAVQELSEDDLLEGSVTIDVEWSAINYKDGLAVQPKGRVARRSPLIPGVDLAGTVAESTAGEFRVGQSVLVHGNDLGVAHHGGFAERARVPAAWVVPLPEGLTARQAMVIGTAGFTAVLSLRRLVKEGLSPSDGPVLVTGASGGVGSMAIATLAHHGFEVVASSGKDAEHDYLRGLGAQEVIGREIAPEDGRVLGQERWAGAIDCVGGQTLGAVLRTLRYGAGVAASGLTAGADLQTTVYPFIIRNVGLYGVDSVLTPIELRRAVWADIAQDFDPAVYDQLVAREIGLEELDAALAQIMAAQVRGRILVRPSS